MELATYMMSTPWIWIRARRERIIKRLELSRSSHFSPRLSGRLSPVSPGFTLSITTCILRSPSQSNACYRARCLSSVSAEQSTCMASCMASHWPAVFSPRSNSHRLGDCITPRAKASLSGGPCARICKDLGIQWLNSETLSDATSCLWWSCSMLKVELFNHRDVRCPSYIVPLRSFD